MSPSIIGAGERFQASLGGKADNTPQWVIDALRARTPEIVHVESVDYIGHRVLVKNGNGTLWAYVLKRNTSGKVSGESRLPNVNDIGVIVYLNGDPKSAAWIGSINSVEVRDTIEKDENFISADELVHRDYKKHETGSYWLLDKLGNYFISLFKKAAKEKDVAKKNIDLAVSKDGVVTFTHYRGENKKNFVFKTDQTGAFVIKNYQDKLGVAASGSVLFTRLLPAPVGGIVIPMGATVAWPGHATYKTTSAATITEGGLSTTAQVLCDIVGESGNAPANAITGTNAVGVDSVKNSSSFTNGEDNEIAFNLSADKDGTVSLENNGHQLSMTSKAGSEVFRYLHKKKNSLIQVTELGDIVLNAGGSSIALDAESLDIVLGHKSGSHVHVMQDSIEIETGDGSNLKLDKDSAQMFCVGKGQYIMFDKDGDICEITAGKMVVDGDTINLGSGLQIPLFHLGFSVQYAALLTAIALDTRIVTSGAGIGGTVPPSPALLAVIAAQGPLFATMVAQYQTILASAVPPVLPPLNPTVTGQVTGA